jgi:hypothetical protein
MLFYAYSYKSKLEKVIVKHTVQCQLISRYMKADVIYNEAYVISDKFIPFKDVELV